ncbi:MAG: hypothetical protein ABIQ12_02905 [Opitutaceae bacterium]
MRHLLLGLLLIASSALGRAADVEFVRVWPGWRDAEAFDRIAEYFGGGESQAKSSVLRTHPEARAGYYFLVRLKSANAVAGAKFQVSVIRPDGPEPKTYSFPAAVPEKETVLQLGLTGADWPGGKKTNPVAWKVSLLAADGRLLAEHKSFLWEKPEK